jgi:hypothetical protein
MKLRIGSFWYEERIYRTATLEPGMRMKEVEREVTEALTSDSSRATHSGTGDGSGMGGDIMRGKAVWFVVVEVKSGKGEGHEGN